MSFIKDVLEEKLSDKKVKLNNNIPAEHEITAKIMSKNKIKSFSDENIITENQNFDDSLITKNFITKFDKSIRGWIDFNSLSLRYNNEQIFYKYFSKINKNKKELFKIFNATRCLALGFNEYIGCKKNFELITHNFYQSIGKKKIFIFDFLLKNFFTRKKQGLKKFKKYFPKVNSKKLTDLIESIDDQDEFCKYVLRFIDLMGNFDEEENIKKSPNNLDNKNMDLRKQKTKEYKKEMSTSAFIEKKKSKNGSKNNEFHKKQIINNELLEIDKYKVFTRKYDDFINARKLVEFKELIELRKRFDDEYKFNTKIIDKLARKLERLLSSSNVNSWKFDQEEGFFDSSKFANFIANPENPLIFKTEKQNPSINTVVCLLLDNSGSMRGKPIITAAITTEIITKTLEKCRVNVEILGFTTKEWKGGNSKKDWNKLGKNKNPGRLNDILHIIYKDADTQWNACKNNLGLVLKEGLLKENIDGEALQWANDRLKKRNEKKKIMIVISDGAPVDDSTLSTNSPNILDNHLKEVVFEIENKKEIQLLAIGIGHDVSKYYKNAFTIDDVNMLGEVIIDNLTKMLKPKRIRSFVSA